MVEAWCMKCKGKVDMLNPQEVVTRNNLLCVKGQCPVCNTNVSRIQGKAKSDEEKKSEVDMSPQPGHDFDLPEEKEVSTEDDGWVKSE